MIFDVILITILALITFNFLIIFFVKNPLENVMASVISHLLLLLIFVYYISNHTSLEELAFVLIFYSGIFVFFLPHKNNFDQKNLDKKKYNKFAIIAFFIAISLIFFATFFLTNNLVKTANLIRDHKINQEIETTNYSLESSIDSNLVDDDKNQILQNKLKEKKQEKTEYVVLEKTKIAQLKDKLSENFFLKHISEIILIISSIAPILLIISNNKSANVL
jgi:hypothetical protein